MWINFSGEGYLKREWEGVSLLYWFLFLVEVDVGEVVVVKGRYWVI